ncbi:MAG: hypothetical protein WB421_00175, partial [Terriglobales bacterium]
QYIVPILAIPLLIAFKYGKPRRYLFDFLARLSHLEGIFCLRARKFLLLSTSALRKSAKTG